MSSSITEHFKRRQQIRLSHLQKRAALSQAQIQALSQQICHNLLTTGLLDSCQHLGYYQAIKGEVDLTILLSELDQQVKFNELKRYLPILHPAGLSRLWFGEVNRNTILQRNSLGFLAPAWKSTMIKQPYELDVVLVPLLAFDNHFHRLGMGAGYYDRSFAWRRQKHRTKPLLIGLAYEWQRVENLWVEPHDIALDRVITDFA